MGRRYWVDESRGTHMRHISRRVAVLTARADSFLLPHNYTHSQLVNALATLGEYPLIRYYNPPSSFHGILGPGVAAGEHVCKRLAERVQREIDAYARDNTDFPVSLA